MEIIPFANNVNRNIFTSKTFLFLPVWSRCLRDSPYRDHVLVWAGLEVVHDALAAGANAEGGLIKRGEDPNEI